jgi:hypothetical protein
VFDLRRSQERGRLVEEENATGACECPGNLDPLPLGVREVDHEGSRGALDAEGVEVRRYPGFRIH